MPFWRPIQWYHFHVDPIWPDGTFNITQPPDDAHTNSKKFAFFNKYEDHRKNLKICWNAFPELNLFTQVKNESPNHLATQSLS